MRPFFQPLIKRIALACMLLPASAAWAQSQFQRTLVNASFEQPALNTAGCRVYIGAGRVDGWETTHSPTGEQNVTGCTVPAGFGAAGPLPIIELWRTPRSNTSGGAVNAPDGVQIAEINANEASRLYQNLCLFTGETLRWALSHRGRTSASTPDVAAIDIGLPPIEIARIGTTNNGTPVNTPANVSVQAVAGNTTWRRYAGSHAYAGASGLTPFGFSAVSTADNSTTNGNLIDDVSITLAPLVEFVAAASADTESSGANLPRLRVVGTVPAGFTVQVQITGGTATAADVGAVSPISVPVAAGVYAETNPALVTVPLGIVNDTLVEPDETLNLSIVRSTAYVIASTAPSATCGDAGLGASVYTILNDDVAPASGIAAVPAGPWAPVAALLAAAYGWRRRRKSG